MAESFSCNVGLVSTLVQSAESTSFSSLNVPRTMRLAWIANNLRWQPREGLMASLRFVVVALAALANDAARREAHCQAANIHFNMPNGYYGAYQNTLNYTAGATVGSDDSIHFFRIAEEVDGDGIPGAIVIVDPDTGMLTTLTDFGDLHQFNIGFDGVIASGIPTAGAVDVVNVIWLGDDEVAEEEEATFALDQAAEALRVREWEASGADNAAAFRSNKVSLAAPGFAPQFANTLNRSRKNGVGLVYGMRALERQDLSLLHASGGVIGKLYVDTTAENHIIGPQVGVIWIKTIGRWSTRLQGLASLGFNYGDVTQDTEIGSELVPGATNRLLYAQPTRATHSDTLNEFSPNTELRAELNFRITQSATFAISWSGVAITNALETDGRIRYSLPDMGLVDPGNQRILVHNFFCGVELVR